MFVRILIRVILAALFGTFGNAIGKGLIPENWSLPLPSYTPFITTIVFVIIGLFLPDLLRVVARLGIGHLAEDITLRLLSQMTHIPQPFGGRRPTIPRLGRVNNKSKYQNPLVADTSALIDGRLADIAETGFLFGTIIVDLFVLTELRHIADLKDPIKRARGRMGLEVLSRLKKNKYIKIVVASDGDESKDLEVDQKIINLAKKLKARIITCDYNLNQAAAIMKIDSLNVNQLANKIKTSVLPGEEMEIKVVQMGKEKGQGVGYLADGTMVVVEEGKNFLGENIKVEVKRIIQTAAGKMIFTKAQDLG